MLWIAVMILLTLVGFAGFVVGIAFGQERGIKNEQRK